MFVTLRVILVSWFIYSIIGLNSLRLAIHDVSCKNESVVVNQFYRNHL